MKTKVNKKHSPSASFEGFSKEEKAILLKNGIKLLSARWGLNTDQCLKLLRVSRTNFFKSKKGELREVDLDEDQLTRISMLLNIHSYLRILFSNPENIYGFITMENKNLPFNGKTPFQLMESGNIFAIKNVHDHIDGLRGGVW